MTQADLNRLKRDTNAAIAKIKADKKGRPKEAINWADLRCVDVRSWRDCDSFDGVTVYIEEADPGCWKLRHKIAELLQEKWGYVEVNCEW